MQLYLANSYSDHALLMITDRQNEKAARYIDDFHP